MRNLVSASIPHALFSLACFVVGVTACCSAGNVLAAPAKFDFNLFYFPRLTSQQQAKVIDTLKETRTEWLRLPFSWAHLEPTQGNYRFEMVDKAIVPLTKNGFKILLICNGAPTWAAATDEDCASNPPRDPKQYARFLNTVARRYKGKDMAYEIWNEPDNPPYWGKQQSTPEEYMALLKPASKTIREVDPTATIVAGAVLIQFMADPKYSYLEKLLELGMLDYCDAVSVHIYPRETAEGPAEFRRTLARVEEVVRKHGDKEIWVTEVSRFSRVFSRERLIAQLRNRGLTPAQLMALKNDRLCRLALQPAKVAEQLRFLKNSRKQIDTALSNYGLTFEEAEEISAQAVSDESKEQAEMLRAVYEESRSHRMFWFQLYDIAFSMGVLNKDLSAKTAYDKLKTLVETK